ncbi:MAG: biotin synthase BioB [Candidatus Omnitrophica bacterium]|nr:biotin synthase BioB [Candidatus Omnitrophota bacterium]
MDYASLVSKSLRKELLRREEGKAILSLPDEEVPELLQASFEVRKRFHGKKVKLCMLQNAQSGLCPEDCHYCSQSSISKADIEKYPLLSKERLLEGARRAYQAGAKRYCMVTSGRGPSKRVIDHFREATETIKKEFPLEICCCLGIMTEEQAHALKEAGVGWVNHNLNTSRRFYPEICTTHTYEDRVDTVENVAKAGLGTCSGGIVGMGETEEDILDLAFAVRALQVESIPINFLHPIPGTPLEKVSYITPFMGLKILCLFRFLNPDKEIRAAGGRELKLGTLQRLALYPASSIFIDGYLTTPGQKVEEAHRMIEEEGFEIEESS